MDREMAEKKMAMDKDTADKRTATMFIVGFSTVSPVRYSLVLQATRTFSLTLAARFQSLFMFFFAGYDVLKKISEEGSKTGGFVAMAVVLLLPNVYAHPHTLPRIY